jgi:hypothetical protein
MCRADGHARARCDLLDPHSHGLKCYAASYEKNKKYNYRSLVLNCHKSDII